MNLRIFLFIFLLHSCCLLSQRSGVPLSLTIAFWNVENLFDTIDDKYKSDEDFTPGGIYRWNSERYHTKLHRLSEILSELGDGGPVFFGLCEVENRSVLADLAATPLLSKRNYHIAHREGPDARGIDPAFLYDPAFFKLGTVEAYPVKMITDTLYRTRQILVVSGTLLGEDLTVLVCHWPSRRGGEKKSRKNRNEAARVARQITDSLLKKDKARKIILMGDLNDDPVNYSVKKILGTCGDLSECDSALFYNPMEKLYQQGIGSLAYHDSWNLFDQILFSENFFHRRTDIIKEVHVYNKAKLRNHSGRYKDYPFRTLVGTTYTGGYSDHFPVFVTLQQ